MVSKRRTPVLLCVLALAALPLAAEMNVPDRDKNEDSHALNVLVTIRVGAPDAPVKSYQLVADGGGQAAKLMDGQRVPIPTTTFQTSSPPDVIVPMTSYTYQNVGFEAEVRAWVQEDGRIKIVAEIEDSRLADEPAAGGRPVIQTRHQRVHGTLIEGEPLRMTRVEEEGAGVRYLEILAEVLN